MKRAWLVSLLLAGGGCIGDLDPKQLVVGPRILDIIADPPEVRPGGAATFSVFLAGTRGTPEYQWQWCLSNPNARPMTGASDFGTSQTEEGCFGTDGGPLSNLGTGSTATLPIPSNLLTSLEMAASRDAGAGQTQLSPELIAILAREIGLVLGVAVTVRVDGRVMQGYKRFVVSTSTDPNVNPPPPRFRFGGRWVHREPGSDRRCVAEDGMPLTARPGSVTALVPDPDEARWSQTYRILTAVGTLDTREEQGYYSWYTTGGTFARGLTRSPTRDNEWQAPSAPGPVTLWVFLRDGHGGTSACEAAVAVQ